MRKFLGTAMSVALLFGTVSAQAEILQNLETHGSVEIQGRGVNNATDFRNAANDYDGQFLTRVSAGLDFDLTDDVEAALTLTKVDRTFGSGGQTFATVEGLVTFSEANITVKDALWLDHKVGRQYYGDQGDLLVYFGPSQAHQVGLPVGALDAWKATHLGEDWSAHAIFAKVADDGAGLAGTDTDTDMFGLAFEDHQYDLANFGGRVYQRKVNTFGGAAGINQKTYFVDVDASGRMEDMGLSYGGELLLTLGDGAACGGASTCARSSAKGVGVLINGAWKGDMGPGMLKIKGEFGYGSGDDTADDDDKTVKSLASDYRPGMIWGGLAGNTGNFAGLGAAGLTGVTAGNLGTGLTTFNGGAYFAPAAVEDLWLGAHYYYFRASKAAAGLLNTAASKNLGQEVDLSARVQKSDNVSVGFGYAWFFPGDGMSAASTGSTVSMASADVSVRF